MFCRLNNEFFDLTIKRCIYVDFETNLRICKLVLLLHTGEFEEALNYVPLRKTLR